MRKLYFLLMLLFLSISIPTDVYAEVININNVYYELKDNGTALVAPKTGLLASSYSSYEGALNIPSTIEYKNVTYKVTGFGKLPMTLPDIPTDISDVTTLSVGEYFNGLSTEHLKNSPNLASINIDENNPYYSSSDGVLYNKKQTELILCPLGKSGTYKISDKTQSINKYAFYQSKLQQILVPKTVTTINQEAFTKATTTITLYGKYSDYTFLSSLDLSSAIYASHSEYNSITSFFSGKVYTLEKFYVVKQTKTQLTSVTFTIPVYRWQYIKSHDLTINGTIVNGYSIKRVTVENKETTPNEDGSYTATGLRPNNKYAVHFYWDRYSKNGVIAETGEDEDSIETAIQKVSIEHVKSSSGSIKLKATASQDESMSPTEHGCFCIETNEYYKAKNGYVNIENLTPFSEYSFYPYAIYSGEYVTDKSSVLKIRTLRPEFKYDVYVRQTTLSVNSFSVVAENTTEKPIQLEVYSNGKAYKFEGEPVLFKELTPKKKYNIEFTARYKNGTTISKWVEYETGGTNPWFRVVKITPTTALLKATYNAGDATFTKAYFKGHEDQKFTWGQSEGGSSTYRIMYFTLTHLRPGEDYSHLTFVVETKEGGQETYTINKGTIKTEALKLEVQPAKVIGNNCALVGAETNIDSEETNVGFEWRKTDAPDVVVSKFGAGIIYDNVLEGRISNLSATSYYKVRAYYQSKDEKKYYSSWIGFDPSDFSFFEPTVHTYANINVENNTARVRGIALQGSDDIVEQGFEYWIEGENKSRSAEDIQTVLATGQSMEAELIDLAYNSTYNCRAFVKTAKSTTYGETQQFTTPKQEVSGINNIAYNGSECLNFAVKQEGCLKISISGNNETYQYRIANISGNQIAQGHATADNNWQNITEQRLPKGIYVISVTNNKQMKAKKIAIK